MLAKLAALFVKAKLFVLTIPFIFSVTGGPDLTLHEVQEAANVIYSAVSDDANIIFGAVLDDRLHGEVLITVIATGFDMVSQQPPYPTHTARTTPPVVRQQIQPERPAAPANTNGKQDEIKKIASDLLDIPEFLRARNGR